MNEPTPFQDHQGTCWLLGHDADWFYDSPRCQRCGENLSYEEMGWLGVPGWLAYWRELFHEWRKCRYCGKRFGKHVGECLDIPF